MNKLRILRLCVASIFSIFCIFSPIPLAAEEQPISVSTSIVQDINCLAAAIHHEARGESKVGQLAVAHVVLNRMASGRFPDSLCGVVYQRTPNSCQFSWVCQSSKRREEPNSTAKEIAWDVVMNETKDPSKGSLFFHTTNLGQAFNRKKTIVIGNHVFYK